MTTLYTAKKYAVPALEAHCVEFLKKNLRADNAFMLLTQVRDALVSAPSAPSIEKMCARVLNVCIVLAQGCVQYQHNIWTILPPERAASSARY